MYEFQKYIKLINKDIPKLIVGGDFNICHEEIDIHNPKIKVSGFLPWERKWIDKFLEDGYIDSFRFHNKSPHNYTWWSYRANSRVNNKGWRIDYLLATNHLKNCIKQSYILDDIVHSDHCPIGINLKL